MVKTKPSIAPGKRVMSCQETACSACFHRLPKTVSLPWVNALKQRMTAPSRDADDDDERKTYEQLHDAANNAASSPTNCASPVCTVAGDFLT